MNPESTRLDLATFRHLAPETVSALLAISAAAKQSGLGAELIELAKLRASLMNGCTFCIEMHASEARRLGVSEERLAALEQWGDSPLYTRRERAALAWTDALTRLEEGDLRDPVFREASGLFSDVDLAALTSVVVTINAWNRISVAYRFSHKPNTEGQP